MSEITPATAQRGAQKTARMMPGLGETDAEVPDMMQDMRLHGVDMLAAGQCLQPRPGNSSAQRCVEPPAFEALAAPAHAMGIVHAACGPLARSSDHAGLQAHAACV
jgi:lipoic acid synthetase